MPDTSSPCCWVACSTLKWHLKPKHWCHQWGKVPEDPVAARQINGWSSICLSCWSSSIWWFATVDSWHQAYSEKVDLTTTHLSIEMARSQVLTVSGTVILSLTFMSFPNLWARKKGFPKTGVPQNGLVYNGKSSENGSFRGTPIDGNPQVRFGSHPWFAPCPSSMAKTGSGSGSAAPAVACSVDVDVAISTAFS